MTLKTALKACAATAILLAWLGCKPEPKPRPRTPDRPAPAMDENKGLDVFDSQGRKVLWIKDEPGPLLSTALPPPGAKPPSHPFLTGQAFYAPEEGRLRELLDASKDFKDFTARLKQAGYTVQPAK